MVTVISDSVIPNSLGSYMRIRYIRFQFCVITVSVISDSVILVSIISDSYLVISDSLYLIPLYQNPLYQIHCGPISIEGLPIWPIIGCQRLATNSGFILPIQNLLTDTLCIDQLRSILIYID